MNARIDQMIAQGWLEEARAIATLGLPSHSPAGKALGYPELAAVARGERDLASTIDAIKIATRQYARAQMTWFRRRRDALMLDSGDNLMGRVEAVLGVG
jgi:tRNA dimethylallyltransferase